jgi:transposase-like protein
VYLPGFSAILLLNHPMPKPKSKTKPKPNGRPTDYSPELGDEIVKRTMMGEWKATNQQIAAYCGVEAETVRRWRHKYPKFDLAIQKAKVVADNRVEGCLHHSACSGNVQAQIHWLNCRRPDEWHTKREVDIRTPDGGIQVQHSVADIIKMINLRPEQKSSLTRKHRDYLDELKRLELLPESAIDIEPEE